MPRFSELASRRSVLKEHSRKYKVSFAFLAVAFMLLTAFIPLIPNACAVSQSFSNSYDNPTVVPIIDGGGVGNPVSSTITVTDAVTVTSIDVYVDAPRRGAPAIGGRARDTVLILADPDGDTLTLYNNPGAPVGQQDVSVNLFGDTFFSGKSALGVWTLYAYDRAMNGRYNKINDFALTIYWDYHTDIVSPDPLTPTISSNSYTVQVDSNGISAELWIDGSDIGAMAFNGGTGYWEYTLDTFVYHDGIHNMQVKTTDSGGNAQAVQLAVTVDNYQISASIQWPLDGSTISGPQTIWTQTQTYAIKGTLSVDGIVVVTDNNPPGGGWYQFNLNTANFRDGHHTVIATTYDPENNFATSTVDYIFSNYAVSCTITDPLTGSTLSTSPYTIRATVPATAVKGELYVDGILTMVTTTIDGSSQYTFDLTTTNYKDGPHTLEVRAYNAYGDTASDVVNVQFDNYQISVGIAWPNTGTTVSGAPNVFVQASSYAVIGRLYVDNNLYQTINAAPQFGVWYIFNWDTTSTTDGMHTLRVEAVDPDGNIATASQSPTVNNYGTMTVQITAPGSGSTQAGPVDVIANTQNYALKGELYVDGSFVAKDSSLDGGNNYQFQFDTTVYKDGDHTIAVRAYDPDGNFVQDSIQVTFDNYAISVTIDQPLTGDIVSSTLLVQATVPSYARYSDLMIDGQFQERTATQNGFGQFEFNIVTTDFSDGSHIIMIIAYDPDGNMATDSVQVTFDNYDISVSIQFPASGATISGASSSVWVNTDDYATKVEVYIDTTMVASTSSPIFTGWYNIVFDTRAFKDGTHTLSARAYDPDGNYASQAISVTVSNNKLTLSITTPADGSTQSGVSMSVRATTQAYAVLGECYIDDQLVKSIAAAPSGGAYTFTIDTTKFKDAPHVIKVIAYNIEGTGVKDTRTVIFRNWAISITINSPVDGATISTGSTAFQAQIVTSVREEFYLDGTLMGVVVNPTTSVTCSFTINTRLFTDGVHIVKAIAYDPDGKSAADSNTYIFSNFNMGVSITSPAANTKSGGSVTVTASVTDNANSAFLYVDNALVVSSYLARSAGQSYSFTFDTRGFTDGNHILRVQASYSVSGESAFDSRPLQFDNTAPTVSGLAVIYLNGLTAVKAAGDNVVITAQVFDATSGINSVMLDATNIGGGSSLTMFDDGSHHDGEAGDGTFGSDQVAAAGKMGYMRVFVKATDKVGNTNTQSVSVAIDDHSPMVTNTYIIYPSSQTGAKTGDSVRVIAKVVDTTVFVDNVMIIDTSGSMAGTPIADAKTAAKSFVDDMNPNDQSAVYSFDNPAGAGNSPKLEIGFTNNKNNVKNKIDGLAAQDWTPLYDTIFAAIAYAKTSNNMPVLIVLTDGVDCLGTDGSGNCNKFSSHPITDVEGASIPIFTIGLGAVDAVSLKAIADSSNGGAYYFAPSSSDLKDIYETIAGKIVEFEVGGISSVTADMSNIGSGNSIPLYDDGNHDDGKAHDNVFGSEQFSITSLATDKFNYTILAKDVGGNQATLLGFINIDNTPPTITNVKPVFLTGNWWAKDTDSVQFTADVKDLGNVGGVVTVRLDASGIGGGTSIVMRDDGTNGDAAANDGTYTSDIVLVSTGLATGIKIIQVTANDIANNLGSGAGSIYVDNHRPLVLELISPSLGQYIEGTYTFQVRSNDVQGIDQVALKIDNVVHSMAYNAQSSFYEFIMDTSSLPDAAYKASISVSDLVGRVSLGPQDQLFYIDNTPPTLVLNAPKDGDVVTGLVRVNTTGTTDQFLAAIEYKPDDLAWNPVTTLWNTSKLVDGEHTLTVRALDTIGHVTTRTITVIVDNGNPSAYFVTPVTGDVLEGKVTFQIKATDLVKVTSVALTGSVVGSMEYNSGTGYYEYEVDTTLKADGTYSAGAIVLDPGSHTLTLAPVTFSIDNNFPVLKVLYPTNNAFLKGNITVKLNVTDGPFQPTKVEWRVDEGTWKTLPGPNYNVAWNTTTYSDAKHTLYAQATDRAGHMVLSSVSVTVDNNPPTVDLASPVNGQYLTSICVFKMHAYDTVGIDKLVLKMDGVNSWTIINNEGASYFEQVLDTTTIKDGTYNVTVTAYDLSGQSTKTTMIKVKVDNNAPLLMIYSPSEGEYLSGDNYTITGTATDLFMSKILYDVDGSSTRLINQTLDTTLLSDGQHIITVTAYDLQGHTTSKSLKVYVDNNKPSVSPVSPQQLEPVFGKYTFRIRAEDVNGIESVKMKYGNITINLYQNSITGYFEATRDTIYDQDGNINIVFNVTDRSGKGVNMSVPSHIDNSAPNVTMISPGNDAKGIIKFRATVIDPSGIDTVMIRVGGGEWREMRFDGTEYQYRWRSVYSDNGDQPYDIKVTDKLGNQQIYSYNLAVQNKSTKANYDWLWWVLFLMLIVTLLAVALTSRTGRSQSPRRDRPQTYGYQTKMAAEEGFEGAPRAMPGRRASPEGAQPMGPPRELGTPAHRVAVRKMEGQNVVVSQPTEDEVTFLADDMSAPPVMVGALRTTASMDQGSEDVEFLDDSAQGGDDVSFEEDGVDDVSFSEDSGDDVSFSEDSGDDVSFSEDPADEVAFSDDSATPSDEDVEFLDDEAPSAPVTPKPAERKVPVTLTPRAARATPTPMAKRPPPTVSTGAIKGIDDLLSGGSAPAPRAPSRPPAPKAKPAPSKGGSPLDEVIGDL